ncbi:MAG: hypothetical protein P8Y03_28495 [Anaerolineales bacterium]
MVTQLLLKLNYEGVTTLAQNLPDHLQNCSLRWPGWSRARPMAPGAPRRHRSDVWVMWA